MFSIGAPLIADELIARNPLGIEQVWKHRQEAMKNSIRSLNSIKKPLDDLIELSLSPLVENRRRKTFNEKFMLGYLGWSLFVSILMFQNI